MSHARRWIGSALVALTALACAREAATPAADTQADVAAIIAVRDREAALLAAGSMDSMLAQVYSDDVLFHPTGRTLGQRPALDFDLDAVLAAARRTGTALDLDAQPSRLDLKDEHVRRAVAAGVKLVITSDAHDVDELRYADSFGVAVARRGWATAEDVLNTRELPELLAALKDGARRPRRRAS